MRNTLVGKIHDNQSGFSAIETVLVLVIVALIGAAGFIVYKNQNKKSSDDLKVATNSSAEKTSSETSEYSKTDKEMTLASNSVSFKVPKSYIKDGAGCNKESAAYGNQEYVDSTAILPGEKLTTIYGSDFHINVCVFNNKNNLSPKDWFEDGSKGGIGMGTGSPQDESSTANINGNSAFYRKTKQGYEEVDYVISAKGKLVLVRARTYEVDEEAPDAGDFRKFEPAIKDLVSTITVK